MTWNRQQEEPGGRQPAPGALATVQAFVNSVDLEDGIERFDHPSSLSAWLAERGLLDPDAILDDDDLSRAIAVREALRDLLAVHGGDETVPDAGARLARAAGAAALTVGFGPGGEAELHPRGEGIDAVFARLLAIAYEATIDGTWQRLKTCRNAACRWAFFDASKNRSGAWCTMAICGAKGKARTYRRRLRGAAGGGTGDGR